MLKNPQLHQSYPPPPHNVYYVMFQGFMAIATDRDTRNRPRCGLEIRWARSRGYTSSAYISYSLEVGDGANFNDSEKAWSSSLFFFHIIGQRIWRSRATLKDMVARDHRVHRVTTANFLRTFHHDEEISPGWWGVGGHVHLPLLCLPSRTKLWCALQLRG